MQDLSDEERRGVLGEVLMDELKVIHEYVKDIPIIKKDLAEVKQKVNNLTDDMTVVKAVLRDHEKDIKRLKAKVA